MPAFLPSHRNPVSSLPTPGEEEGFLFAQAPRAPVPLDSLEIVVLDLETTGFLPWGRVIELAGVVLSLPWGTLGDAFHSLVNPRCKIPRNATAMHGIRDDDVEDAPYFPEVWGRWEAWAGERPLLAHNGRGFDYPVLRTEFTRWGTSPRNVQVYDSLQVARQCLKKGVDVESHTLASLAAWAGVEGAGQHRAMADCEVLGMILPALLQRAAKRTGKVSSCALFHALHGPAGVL